MRPVALAVLLVALLLLGVVALPFGALEQQAYGENHYGSTPESPDKPDPQPSPSPTTGGGGALTGSWLAAVIDCFMAFYDDDGAVNIPGSHSTSPYHAAVHQLEPARLGASLQTRPPALRYWDSGLPISEADRAKGLPIRDFSASISPTAGFLIQFRLTANVIAVVGFPHSYRVAFDLPDRRGGPQNHFAGPGFEEDLVVYARADSPGQYVLGAVFAGRERSLGGAVEVTGDRVGLRIPLRAAAEVGLIAPGMRVILGTVGPAPARVFHRLPERDAFQFGLPGGEAIDAATLAGWTRVKHDFNADRKDDLYFLDTNRNGQIDAVAYDRNGDGQIAFRQLEGPNVVSRPGGTAQEFDQVERAVSGKQLRLRLRNSQMVYLIVVEDKNGDGDVADAGEFEGRFVELR